MLKRVHTFGLCAVLALAAVSDALAQGVPQAFAYQGYLRQNNVPVTNSALPMRFRIYDAATGGNLVWESANLTVSVREGLFTVTLDPPASVWTGAPRFLEIQINPPSGPTLSPRTPINPAPYANTATLLNMFQSGINNPDRMVITHSPSFPDWGLQYRDRDASFHFIGAGITRLRIGLGDGLLQYPLGAAEGYVLTSDASGVARWRPLPSGVGAWAVSGNNIYNTNSGNVGIGTNNPEYLLDIRGSSPSALVYVYNTNGSPASAGVRIRAEGFGSTGLASAAIGDRSAAVYSSATVGSWAGYFDGLVYCSEARVGSSETGGARLSVTANSSLNFANLRLHEADNDVARLEFTNSNTSRNTRKWHIAGYIGTGTTATHDGIAFWNSGYPHHGGNVMRIRGDGVVEVRVLEITGADLAEKFPVTDAVEPGMVVEIDPDNPGNLRKARGAYNKRVVGVVAGANGLPKGVILGDTEGSEHHVPVALSGRVWVYADATEHAIEPGDFLTTAERPGYAMKASDLAKARGAIIGKALTRLEKGKTGMVLMVVNLQ